MNELAGVRRPDYALLGNGKAAYGFFVEMIAREHPPSLVVLNVSDRQRDVARLQEAAVSASIPVLDWGTCARDRLFQWTAADPDRWLISVYFGHLLDEPLLEAAGGRAVNLHPSLLPWCRGVHTNVWPLIEKTPAGVSLHTMVSAVDAGPVIEQVEVPVHPWDTAGTLYERLTESGLRLLLECWPEVVLERWPGTPQAGEGTRHLLADFKGIEAYAIEPGSELERFFDLLRARSFPPYPGLKVRVGGRTVEATLNLRPVDD